MTRRNKMPPPRRPGGPNPGPAERAGGPRGPHPDRPRQGAQQTARGAEQERERPTGLWLYGIHAVESALANSRRHVKRIVASAAARETLGERLERAAIARRIGIEEKAREEIDRLLPVGAVHQGIAIQVEPLPDLDVDDVAAVESGQSAVLMVLDQVTDPHNVGAVLRSAAAFGARAVIMTDRNAPGESGALAKAASGALDLVPLVRATNLSRALERLAALGYWRIGLDGDAPKTLAETDTSGPIAFVLGAEGAGLRRLTAEKCDFLARLPIDPRIESLNVSNAAAIALYERARGG
jgi:23S rRNA (guanosine2251-2'-O)-methyltransferase